RGAQHGLLVAYLHVPPDEEVQQLAVRPELPPFERDPAFRRFDADHPLVAELSRRGLDGQGRTGLGAHEFAITMTLVVTRRSAVPRRPGRSRRLPDPLQTP